MKLKITVDLIADISDQRAFERYQTHDAYSTAQAMTRDVAVQAEEIKADMQSEAMKVEHVGVVVIPLHG